MNKASSEESEITTYLDSLSVIDLDHMETEAINPFPWCYKYTGSKIKMVANIN